MKAPLHLTAIHHRQSGSALIYILIAVALLAALTVSLMEPSNQQAQTQSTTNLVTSLDSQVSFISSAIQECTLSYPDQDSGLTLAEQNNPPYPINPSDDYFDDEAADPGSAANDDASGIRCPGNPGGSGSTNQDHARIFGGGSGKFLPPPPALFGPWTYYNGVDGIFIMTSSDKSDAYIQAALTRLDGMYSNCEADVINRLGTSAVDITGEGVTARQCAAGYICFRYWIKQNASASDQISAGCP